MIQYSGHIGLNGSSLEALQDLLSGGAEVTERPNENASHRYFVTIQISEVSEPLDK